MGHGTHKRHCIPQVKHRKVGLLILLWGGEQVEPQKKLQRTNKNCFFLKKPQKTQLFQFNLFQLGWRQDNGNRSNQESKFDFLATRQQLGKIDGGQQKIKIIRTNRQSNLPGSCQSIFSLCQRHPSSRPFNLLKHKTVQHTPGPKSIIPPPARPQVHTSLPLPKINSKPILFR